MSRKASSEGGGGVAGTELIHHVGAVNFHRARADFEFAGDGLVGGLGCQSGLH